MSIYDVAVIGGGAAGCMAAITSGKSGAKTVLFEKNDSIGRKILITGKGRCNITNTASLDVFLEEFGKESLVYEIAEKESQSKHSSRIPLLKRWKMKNTLDNREEVLRHIKENYGEKFSLVRTNEKGLKKYLTLRLIPQWTSGERMRFRSDLGEGMYEMDAWEAYNQGKIPKDYRHLRIRLTKK